ncbi:hypothetical protein [Derxia gummosa]|uniref:Uncharacterized protein n=1 Tax=Derxia gummosa DSM 723 TaxID=1121388 RepID=A0A8B6X2A3_9BURK|nr:hypothetical protein [Derxia gummosa]
MQQIPDDPIARRKALTDFTRAIADCQPDTRQLIALFAARVDQTIAALQKAGNPFDMIHSYEHAAAQIAGCLVISTSAGHQPDIGELG